MIVSALELAYGWGLRRGLSHKVLYYNLFAIYTTTKFLTSRCWTCCYMLYFYVESSRSQMNDFWLPSDRKYARNRIVMSKSFSSGFWMKPVWACNVVIESCLLKEHRARAKVRVWSCIGNWWSFTIFKKFPETSRWKVYWTRLQSGFESGLFQRKISRNNGLLEKVVVFPLRKVPNGNTCSISLKPSLILVSYAFAVVFSASGTDLYKW